MKECNQCGKCCTNYSDGGLSATAEEIDWWENYRPEIFKFVADNKIWIDPGSGKQLTRCPFLIATAQENKFHCSIYNDRPDDCKVYPVNIEQMIKDDCEMLDARDRVDTRKAQKVLDKIMSDSRPAYQRIGKS